MQIGKYPEAMYRVSLKVIVRNQSGEVLVVREKGSSWSLPGGGVDHGEAIDKALKRELYEEVLIDASFTPRFVGADTFYVEHWQRWQMWLVYELDLKDGYVYGKGVDADEVTFIDPIEFKNSNERSEQLVYKWCTEKI
jgi:ADP-ribose pyrophosphatase YjhB (NUDIX family)